MKTEVRNLKWYADALESDAATAESLARDALERAEANAALNAFVALCPDRVIDQARASDRRRRSGKALGPLDGVPIAVKDNYYTADYPTTACSEALPDVEPGRDSAIVANLRAAGVLIFGKTNMHEWAFGATNTASVGGCTSNPHDTDRITGGSSGGSAAAVAAGIVPAALGSDTGGSVRIPAAACGIYGFKPSYGRASRFGLLPLSWSLDAPGPMAATLDDIESLLRWFLGSDPRDPSTRRARPLGDTPRVDAPKLLWLDGPGLERSTEVARVCEAALARTGAAIETRSLDHVSGYFAAWEAILHAEASAYHRARLATQAEKFGAVTRAHLEAGMQLLAVDLLQAQTVRGASSDALLRILGDNDVWVMPTLPVIAPRKLDTTQAFGGRTVSTQDSMTWFCWLANLTGFPCLSLPAGRSRCGMPIGMMVMGRPDQDERVLAIGRWISERLDSDG